ncbi:unnamed protein product [Didymodactylos carnosus]|uniref:Uncharacterized protein n=1 Tax=Didymodactylos carnosus TaxID=1234261 RepID=A0A814IYR2_9BILA|nr:unnamed protein product [Didymodactylos carnosus]CAF1028204.1 unnamed protein product [Didymodactylos carnosus]CAF3583986.1 unnamed protein product [Didymodactylos carnosus]CAF3799215.1 unnamed protein product [Didymodactylos carnosus]
MSSSFSPLNTTTTESSDKGSSAPSVDIGGGWTASPGTVPCPDVPDGVGPENPGIGNTCGLSITVKHPI